MNQYRDVVVNSFIQPIFEGTQTDVKYFLTTTRMDTKTLRVRAGKMQKIVSVEEYLRPIPKNSRKEQIHELLIEIAHLGDSHSPNEIADEYTTKILKIIRAR